MLRLMADPKPTLNDVTIDFGDGVERPIRYSILTLRRLSKRFGKSMIANQVLANEDTLPVLIFEGVCDDDGNPPDGVTIEQIEKLPTAAVPYLLKKFTDAYMYTNPEKKMPWDPNPEELEKRKLAAAPKIVN